MGRGGEPEGGARPGERAGEGGGVRARQGGGQRDEGGGGGGGDEAGEECERGRRAAGNAGGRPERRGEAASRRWLGTTSALATELLRALARGRRQACPWWAGPVGWAGQLRCWPHR